MKGEEGEIKKMEEGGAGRNKIIIKINFDNQKRKS